MWRRCARIIKDFHIQLDISRGLSKKENVRQQLGRWNDDRMNEWTNEWNSITTVHIRTKRESQMLNQYAVHLYVRLLACCWLAWFWKCSMCMHERERVCVRTAYALECYAIIWTKRANRPKRDEYMFVHKSQLRCWYSQTASGCRLRERERHC